MAQPGKGSRTLNPNKGTVTPHQINQIVKFQDRLQKAEPDSDTNLKLDSVAIAAYSEADADTYLHELVEALREIKDKASSGKTEQQLERATEKHQEAQAAPKQPEKPWYATVGGILALVLLALLVLAAGYGIFSSLKSGGGLSNPLESGGEESQPMEELPVLPSVIPGGSAPAESETDQGSETDEAQPAETLPDAPQTA